MMLLGKRKVTSRAGEINFKLRRCVLGGVYVAEDDDGAAGAGGRCEGGRGGWSSGERNEDVSLNSGGEHGAGLTESERERERLARGGR